MTRATLYQTVATNRPTKHKRCGYRDTALGKATSVHAPGMHRAAAVLRCLKSFESRLLDSTLLDAGRLRVEAAQHRADIADLREQLLEANELLLDCAGQFLLQYDDGTVGDGALSTCEALCDYFVAKGKLVPEGGRFRWVKP